jgi:hypothetical protein
MSTSNNRLVKTLSEINPEGLPSFSSLDDDMATSSVSSGSSFVDFFTNITWQTWLIVILILAFLGINVFSYLETGTKETVGIFDKFFTPILQLLGYQTLETTKQVVQTSATGTKAGVDIVADTTTSAIDTIETTASKNASNTNSSTNSSINTTVVGKNASSSLSINNSQPVQNKIQIEKQINELEDWQESNLQKALDDSSRPQEVRPDDTLSRIQKTAGKSGWCFIGEDRGFRTCSQVGENDQCMSGDVFPSQEICMNPNLRA